MCLLCSWPPARPGCPQALQSRLCPPSTGVSWTALCCDELTLYSYMYMHVCTLYSGECRELLRGVKGCHGNDCKSGGMWSMIKVNYHIHPSLSPSLPPSLLPPSLPPSLLSLPPSLSLLSPSLHTSVPKVSGIGSVYCFRRSRMLRLTSTLLSSLRLSIASSLDHLTSHRELPCAMSLSVIYVYFVL